MPTALGGQAELVENSSNKANNHLGLRGFDQASLLPFGIHSSLNPLFGELEFEELEDRTVRSRQAPTASSFSANPLYNIAANKVNLASSSQKALPSYSVPPSTDTNQVEAFQGI